MKTPQLPTPKLAEALGITNEVWLKREDLHHFGSHKGRSIPLMIAEYHKSSISDFIISSSGNAALAAALAVQAHNKNQPNDELSLHIFVGENIDIDKLKNLKKLADGKKLTLKQTADPKRQALNLEKSGQGKWLRQSTDDLALVGYHELAAELAKIINLSAVFIPTSSGTAAQGLHEGFKKLGINPQIHIIQTTSCHPMVEGVIARRTRLGEDDVAIPPSTEEVRRQGDPDVARISLLGMTQPPSLATAIVDKVARRKEKIMEVIKNSRGSGWIASNEEIISAIKLIKKTAQIEISPNSALSIAGLMQAVKSGATWNGPVVCLITGK